MPTLTELRDKYTQALTVVTESRKKCDGVPDEKRSEEIAVWERALDDADKLEREIQNVERQERHEKFDKEVVHRVGFDLKDDEDGGATAKRQKEARAAFNHRLVNGDGNLTDAHKRALQMDNPAGGGFTVAPQTFVAELIQAIKNETFMRTLGRVLPPLTTSESLGVPSLDTDVSDPDWTSEVATGSLDTALAFGKRELKPNPLAKRVKISRTLLRQSALDPAAIVMERLAYKFGVVEENAFLNGTGANQPLGVFVADANGIGTGRDSQCASQTAIVADDLINCKFNLKAAYWAKAHWILGRPVLGNVRKLKDTTNNYIWSTGLGPAGGLQGNPGLLLDMPYHISEYAPTTQTQGLYVAILGDFSQYWICDSLNMEVQVIDQLYAETNQIGYIGRKQTDGMPVLEEAFSRLQMKAT